MMPLLQGRFPILAGGKIDGLAGLDFNLLTGLGVPAFSGLSFCQ
jgi:hypothetical protein